MKNLKYLMFFFFFCSNQVLSVEPQKLLIPGESFKNQQQRQYEISNYGKSGVSYYQWRKTKCYKRTFVLFQRTKLCYHDPHFCAQDYAVDEMHYFHKYRGWLMDIAGVCAEGYFIDEKDTEFIKQPLQKEVDAFMDYIRETKIKVNYDDKSLDRIGIGETKQKKEVVKEKKPNKNQGAHGAVPVPEKKSKKSRPPESKRKTSQKETTVIENNQTFNEKDIKKRRRDLEEEEKRILLEKKILESEIKIMEKRKRLERLKSEIEDSEKKLLKKKEEIVEE